jgi:hypothetical protein
MKNAEAFKEMVKFKSLELARSYVERSSKIQMILMGDDGNYWVGLPKHTEQLHRFGYEYVR